MDFIADNYVWFIIVGIIILMAVIGYFADKTDFGRKVKTEKPEKNVEKIKKKKNKKEKKEKDKKPNKIEVDAKGINELSKDVAEKNALVQENNVLDNNNDEVSFVPPATDDIPTDNQQFSAPTANEAVDQSLFAPLTDQNNTVVDGSQEVKEPTTDAGAVSEVVEEEPENPNENQSEELKNIDSVTLPENTEDNKKNNDVVAEEEDIWKF